MNSRPFSDGSQAQGNPGSYSSINVQESAQSSNQVNRHQSQNVTNYQRRPTSRAASPSQQQINMTQNIMLDKLGQENIDLKKQVDHMKKIYRQKLDEVRVMVGITEVSDLESLLKAKPNSKEAQVLKFYREAKERAETVG